MRTENEAIAPFISLVRLVFTLTKEIIEAYENVQCIKRTCGTLVNRVKAAGITIKFLQMIECGITDTANNNEITMNKLEIQNNEIKFIAENIVVGNERLIEMNEELDGYKKVYKTINYLLNMRINEQDSIRAKDIKASELQDPPKYVPLRLGSRVKIQKKVFNAIEVACKPIPKYIFPMAQKYLATLEKLGACPYIIKFHGLSVIATVKVIVIEWAEYGTLRDVYQNYKINWGAKISIARDICCGLAFLQSVNILHHDIRCENVLINEKIQPKLCNFSFPSYREALNLGLNSYLIKEYCEIIKLSWQQDPSLRPGIQSLFNKLQGLYEKNILKYKGTTVDVPLFPVKVGLEAHKDGNYKKAWDIFETNADVGDMLAKYWKGYYYLVGIYINKNKSKAMKLFKKAADAGNADAQLRYAFCLINKENKNINAIEFMKYLQLAADNNNAAALYNVGDIYFSGKLGIKRDKEKGIYYLRQAALRKHARAKETLDKNNISIEY
ncbi:11916_t:CDS:2 [Rhizophagus irregularis]|nr:11916_t:CDS:2 [Rhizophagus irregularis]